MTREQSKSTGSDVENGQGPIHPTGHSAEAPSEQATTTTCALLAYITERLANLPYIYLIFY